MIRSRMMERQTAVKCGKVPRVEAPFGQIRRVFAA
jgi:hypothetical protein